MPSKLYKQKLALIDKDRFYTLADAIKLSKELPKAKFDETLDLAMKLGIDPRQSDQVVRGAVTLPNGTGKKTTIVVVAEGEALEQAKSAGADLAGFEEVIEKIKGGWLEFDILIATPDAMKKLRPLGRVLGPRGLMPNPKTGTVTDNVADAVAEAKKGRVEYRADRTANVLVPTGKVSFTVEQLVENIEVVVAAVMRAKPTGLKHPYVESCSISSTMGPSINIDLKEIVKG